MVVILSADPGPDVIEVIGQVFRADRVVMMTAATSGLILDCPENVSVVRAERLEDVEAELLRRGSVDVILDLRPALLDDPVRTLLRLFLHVRKGGVYVLDRRSLTGTTSWSRVVALLERLQLKDRSAANGQPMVEQELARSVASMVLTRRLLLLSKDATHLVKLRDRDAVEMLRLRNHGPRVRVVARRQGATFRPRALVQHYGPDRGRPDTSMATMTSPDLTARLYRGKVAMSSHSLLFTNKVVLPESFRYHQFVSLYNTHQINVNEHFARMPSKHRPAESLDGTYFHVDAPVPGHFGHVMTEVISRLWAWDAAKAAYPDLKAIHRLSASPDRADVDRAALRAFGISDADIVSTDRPVFLRSVIGSTPMWHNATPYSVHPDITEVWRRMRSQLVDDVAADRSPIFVSRPPGIKNRPCRNTLEVEEFFASRGFRILHPENHTLKEQANIFACAEVIAGFGGSGLFNVLFSENLSRLIILSHVGYGALNEYLFASVLGCEVHYLWSIPDKPQPTGGWSLEAYQSGWTFDLGQHRATLEELVSRG